jgi:protein SCO1
MAGLNAEKLLKGGVAVLLAATLALTAWVAWTWRSPTDADRLGFVRLARVPDFSLVDQNGRPFRSDALEGKVWAASFIYTRCATSCPLISAQMSLLGRRWANNADFRMVSITVDPLHDSPAVLLAYANGYGYDPDQWTFLTGPPGQVYSLIETGFLASVERLSVEEKGAHVDIPHTTNVMVIDRQGYLRGVFEGVLESDWDRMDSAIGALLKEQ